MSLSVEIELKNVGEEKKLNATFLIKLGSSVLATIFLDNPNVFTREEYVDFVNHKREELEYCELNGRVCLSWQPDNRIKCEVSKIGAGGDGEICLYLEMDLLSNHLLKLSDSFH
jgi:hypothetical protein